MADTYQEIPVPDRPNERIRVPSDFTPDEIQAALADYTQNASQPVVGANNEEYSPPPSPVDLPALGRFAVEMGGSAALTYAAPQIGLPLQAARLLGPIAAKGLTQLLPKVMGSGVGAAGGSLASESFDPTAKPLEAAKEAGKLGAYGELGGRALGSAAQWATKTDLQPGAMQAQRLLGEKGASLTSAQATKSRILDVAENVSEAGLMRTGTQKLKERSETAANDIIQDIINAYASRGTTKDLGGEVQQAIQARVKAWKDTGHQKYTELDQLLGQQPVTVDTREVIRRAQQLGQEAMLKDPQASQLITQIVGNPKRKLPGLSPNISFSDAQRLRSELLSIGGDPSELVKGRRQNYAQLLAELLDKRMEQAATGLKGNPAAYAKWREASAYWKGQQGGMGAGILKDPVITQLMEKDPGVVLDVLLRSGKTDAFALTMNMLPPHVADGVRREFLERAVSAARKPLEGRPETRISGGALAKNLGLEGEYSTQAAALRGMFGKDAQEIRDAVQTLRLTQSAPTDQGFTFVVRGMQLGAVMALSQGVGKTAAPVIMMAPHLAAWAINNPVSRKLIIRANQLPAGTPAALAAAMKFVQFAEANGIPIMGGADPLYLRQTSQGRPLSLNLPQVPQLTAPQR